MRSALARILAVVLLMLVPFVAKSQKGASSQPGSKVALTLLDSLSREPLCYASVYLTSKGDTTISSFILTDLDGIAVLPVATDGNYTLTAEYTGYRKFSKALQIRGNMDLGTILLQEDRMALEAATITAVGNPIVVKQDTVEYNAASFIPSENSMLGDLLKRMPGVEVDSEGGITINGEPVTKIMVGGKTFFFNDPSIALHNLPARIVEKIKVIDKKTDESEFSGIDDNEREKVIDLSLHKKYRQGWFGHVKANAGTTIEGKEPDNPLAEDIGLLYNTSMMLSGYTETDQLTVIGSIYNANSPDGNEQVPGTSGGATNGLSTFRAGGANFNTDRIRGFETNAMVSYKSNIRENRTSSHKTTFATTGDKSDQYTDRTSTSSSSVDGINSSFEIKNSRKNRRKYYLDLAPSVGFTRTVSTSGGEAENYNDEGKLNSSTSTSSSSTDQFNVDFKGSFSLRNLGGNSRRVLNLGTTFHHADSDIESRDCSNTYIFKSGKTNVRDFLYLTDSKIQTIVGTLTYTEPVTKTISFQGTAQTTYKTNDRAKNAFNPDGSANELFSAITDNDYHSVVGRAILQYQKNQHSSFSAGAKATFVNSETYAKTRGVESWAGQGVWQLKVSPSLNYRLETKAGLRVSLYYVGQSVQPSQTDLVPTLNISTPTRISVGNAYLMPSFDHKMTASVRSSNKRNFSFYSLYVSLTGRSQAFVGATWRDNNGIQYTVPVNSIHPTYAESVNFSFNRPVDKAKRLTVGGNLYTRYAHSVSYQSTGKLKGLDVESFDYSDFVSWFWGDTDAGNLFYSGDSGFVESITNTRNSSARINVKYRLERLELSANASVANHNAKYSIDNRADLNTWTNYAGAEVFYRTPHDFEFDTDCRYTFYKGFPDGYGRPMTAWNITASKSIGAFVLTVKVNDILNQSRSLRRNTSENYVLDTYSLILGRYVIAGLTYNFGRMNSRRGTDASNAAGDILK